ncbi:hypothetical protein U91I_03086 [alpha proteobacterium U9-1i]|nr:hypothetical protein U91I_03086 [alpha proteobacterium U9-1i]
MRAWIIVLALAVTGCERASTAKLEPAPAGAVEPDLDVRGHAGDTYSVFVTEAGARYAPEAMGFAAADRARLWRGMAVSEPGVLISGGGAEALVFRGCAQEGCADGRSVVAVDVVTGGVFVGVRDVGGADILAGDERVLALLQTNSANRSWDDPNPPSAPMPPPE